MSSLFSACGASLPVLIVLHLVHAGGVPREACEEMMRECARIWRAVGITVQWSRDGARTDAVADARPDLPYVADVPHVTLILTRDIPRDVMPVAAASRRPLASILFVDGKPTTLIRAYPQEVLRLLEAAGVDGQSFAQRPSRLRFQVMGRALGRAVAHELGHFVFTSAAHARMGLMRANHSSDDILGPSDAHFHVIEPQAACTVVADASTRP